MSVQREYPPLEIGYGDQTATNANTSAQGTVEVLLPDFISGGGIECPYPALGTGGVDHAILQNRYQPRVEFFLAATHAFRPDLVDPDFIVDIHQFRRRQFVRFVAFPEFQ